jgi:plasmid maintenance system antidote protein VapI
MITIERARARVTGERTSTGERLPAHPGQHWLAIIEEKGLSQTVTVRRMGCTFASLSRVLHQTSIPTAPLTVAFARATDSDPKTLWREVADFELAVALLYDKAWQAA